MSLTKVGCTQITSTDLAVRKDLYKTLNLNNQIHRKNRIAALDKADELVKQFEDEAPEETLETHLRQAISKLTSYNEAGGYEPYFAYAVYFLRQRLEGLAEDS